VNLPRGITGFRHVRDLQSPRCDVRSFLTNCHAAARQLCGRVVASELPVEGSANFSRVTLELFGQKISVVLNSMEPFLAFTEPPRTNSLLLQFVDHAALGEYFGASGEYRLLSAADANLPLVAENCHDLAKAEFEQIRYWKPQTIGEVIYNHWD
jgi:hypothetical protein